MLYTWSLITLHCKFYVHNVECNVTVTLGCLHDNMLFSAFNCHYTYAKIRLFTHNFLGSEYNFCSIILCLSKLFILNVVLAIMRVNYI